MKKNIADSMLGKEKIDNAICNALKSFTASFISGRILNPDNAKIVAKINYLTLLSNKDETAPTFVKVAKLYADNKLDAIVEMLKVPEMMRLSQNNRDATERLIMSVKGFPKEKGVEYLKAKADYYKKQAELSEDTYKKTVERMAASSSTTIAK